MTTRALAVAWTVTVLFGVALAVARADAAFVGTPGPTPTVTPTPPPTVIDAFHCYPAKPTKGTRKAPILAGVPLVDLDTVSVTQSKSTDVCAPAAPTLAARKNALINLDRYAIKPDKGQPKPVPHLGLVLQNALGTITLDATKRELVAVPSTTSQVQLQIAPDFDTHEVDRFACYKAKISKGQPKLPKTHEVTIADERTGTPKRYAVKKVTRLCVPTSVFGTAPKHAEHLVCYQVKPTKGRCADAAPQNAGGGCKKEEGCGGTKGQTALCVVQAKLAPTIGLFTSDLFYGLQQDLTKDGEVCLPSIRVP